MDLWTMLSEKDRPVLKKEYHLVLPGGKLDYVHLNEEGYREWGKMIESVLREIKKKQP
jgi:lysophospholipase L1-like esterase